MGQASAQGQLLKSTREARGISLEVVHEVTKIPMDILRAIEEGYTVRTLSPFYLKGFIKMYAEYLKINVQDVSVADYKDYKKPQPAAVVLSSRVSVPPRQTFDFEQWVASVFTLRLKRQLMALALMFAAFFCLFKVITFFTHRHISQGVKVEAVKIKKENTPVIVASVKKVQVSTPKIAEPAPPKTPVKAVVPAEGSASKSKEIRLIVRAKKDTWLRVESDGVIVFQSSLARGKSESWIAKNKIEISGKNMSQLEFELNGKMIGALSRKDNKTKKVVITPEGLSVIP